MKAWLLGAVAIFQAAPGTEGAIVGTIRNAETGEPIAGVVVVLTDVDRAVLSNDDGQYTLRGVAPGPQHIAVRRIGYAPRTLHALVPSRGELEINIALQPQPVVLHSVEVRPPIALRGVEDGESATFPDRGISLAAIRNHPLITEPDAFLALSGGEIVMSPESPSGIHLRGGASDETTYLLDGIPVFSPYHAAGSFSAWNPDAIERMTVSLLSPLPAGSDALAGTVAGVTRRPGERLAGQGSVSTTQIRATVDGPLGRSGGGYLISARSGFPGFISPEREPSYLRGEIGDLLAKLELPVLGGQVRVFGYESENELDAAAVAEGEEASESDPARNRFGWRSSSVGAHWSRRVGAVVVGVQGWRASGNSSALWNRDTAAVVSMAAQRRDDGLHASVEWKTSGTTTRAGARVQRSSTDYSVQPGAKSEDSLLLSARTDVVAFAVGHDREIGRRLRAEVGFPVTIASSGLYASPHAQIRWGWSPFFIVSGTYARSHQFSQSLRNSESVIGSVFPADMYVGTGASGIPVARADHGVVAADYRPGNGMRLGVQAYLRHAAGLVLVAPRTSDPFATAAFATGSSATRGIAIDAAVSRARYGVLANYGWQQVRLTYADSAFTPAHAARHVFESGVIVFPSATSSIRLGASAVIGRRVTAVADAFEWEACNLLDRGCELGGSPRHATDRIGAARLPRYLRLDLGLRKHWHRPIGNRDVMVGVFGTVTNVLGNRNVFAVASDLATGESLEVLMRPRAPLAVGLDWQF